MPYFFVDDAFSDSKEVMSIPVRSRNAAVGLWTCCGAWSMANLTDGFIPRDVVRRMTGYKYAFSTLPGYLVDATLWEVAEGGWQFRNWTKWQRTKASVNEFRERQRDRKRRQRDRKPEGETSANEPRMSRETSANEPRMSRETSANEPTETDVPAQTPECHANVPRDYPLPTPVPVPVPKYLTGSLSSSSHVRKPPPATPEDRDIEPISATDGGALVRAVIPSEHPAATQTALRLRANELLHAGTPPEDVESALRLWLTKPHLGPNALPALVSEVIRSRAPNGVGKATVKALGYRQLGQELIDELHGDQP